MKMAERENVLNPVLNMEGLAERTSKTLKNVS